MANTILKIKLVLKRVVFCGDGISLGISIISNYFSSFSLIALNTSLTTTITSTHSITFAPQFLISSYFPTFSSSSMSTLVIVLNPPYPAPLEFKHNGLK